MRRRKVGDERFHRGRWERHSGAGWAPASYAADLELLHRPGGYRVGPGRDLPAREALLDQAVQAEILDGATLLARPTGGALLSRRRPVSHGLHAVATVLTAGAWAVVWLVMVLSRTEHRYRLDIDPWGNTWPTMGGVP